MLFLHVHNDYLDGGADKDILVGNEGFNIYWGGADADVFKIGRGNDLVEDYDRRQGDRIEFHMPVDFTSISVNHHVVNYDGKLPNGQLINGSIVCADTSQANSLASSWA